MSRFRAKAFYLATLSSVGLLTWIVVLAMSLSAGTGVQAKAATPPAGASGAQLYLDGLTRLAEADWAKAAGAFAKAVDADEENADYRTAHGVALTLQGQFVPAIKDFERSLRLRGDDWETKLWLGAAYKMSGDAATAARYVVHGPRGVAIPSQADKDYSLFMLTLSQNYWSAATRGEYVDPKSGKKLTVRDIAAADFPKAGTLFAERRKSSAPPELAGVVMERIKANLAKNDCAAALKDLDSLLASSPDDDVLRLLRADTALALGDYAGSRADYTRVLTDQPTLASAYVGRARAAAHMADAARAHADLKIAEKLKASGLEAAGKEVDQALSAAVPADPAKALAALKDSAQEGGKLAQLADLALALDQAVNARRLRYDEIYQDRLRVLDEALRAAPRNPDRLADMADFLFAESSPAFEQVEPRSWPVFYRFVPQAVPKIGPTGEILPAPPVQRPAGEVARGSKLVDEALKADPRHVRSMRIKGTILNSQGEYGQARDVLDTAVAIKPDDYLLLRERSVALQAIAREDQLAAGALRTPHISTSNNPDGSSTTTTVYPSAADTARADELEREAKECHQKAVEDMAKVMKLTAGTAMGAYYQGLTDYAYHDVKQARLDFQQAVKLDPKLRVAWEHLAMVCLELKLPEEWAAARMGELNLIQTTAGPWLSVARDEIVRAQFKSARAALAAAAETDAADARIPAYEAVIDAANDKPADALVKYRMALALEQARNRLAGRTLDKPGSLPITPAHIGLTLVLRNRAAALLFQQGKVDEADEIFAANLAWLSAMPTERLATAVSQGSLPGSTADPSSPPLNETYASLKIRAQAGLDYTAWAKRYSDAKEVQLAWQTYNRLVIEYQVADPNPRVIQAVISLGLAEIEASKGNYAKANELLRDRGAVPNGPLWQEMRKTEAQVNKGLQSGGNLSPDGISTLPAANPGDIQRRQLLAQKKQMQELRQATQARLDDPSITDREKQVLRGSIAEYDKVIAGIDKKLNELGAGSESQ